MLPQRGFGVPVGLLGGILVAEFAGCRQEIGRGVKVRAEYANRAGSVYRSTTSVMRISLGRPGAKYPARP